MKLTKYSQGSNNETNVGAIFCSLATAKIEAWSRLCHASYIICSEDELTDFMYRASVNLALVLAGEVSLIVVEPGAWINLAWYVSAVENTIKVHRSDVDSKTKSIVSERALPPDRIICFYIER